MQAEFMVNGVKASSTGAVLEGEVISGRIKDGELGITAKGKRFTIVKIEYDNRRVMFAEEKHRVKLYVKNLTYADISSGETLHF